ncbi:MAG: trypsin-like peptidase domain-containing protein [Deltaproteobacteria bacterium]|nr:trypsin-like peptidase domain-containing protein [Deltaproteobacteria bacterium]
MINFEEVCRPVIYEHDHWEFTYWVKGSSFLIGNSNHYYWVTASHVLNNMGGSANSLRIFPSDSAKVSLPFNEAYIVNKGLANDEDYKDIFMLRVDLTGFDNSGDAPLAAQDIMKGSMPAEQLLADDELWVIGYPSESNFINYESREINNTRSVLRANYKGTSISKHCHTLTINSSIFLDDYDGLSGGPVVHMKQGSYNGQVVNSPLLVGMLLRGTSSSGIAHFVSSNVIVDLVNIAEKMPNE